MPFQHKCIVKGELTQRARSYLGFKPKRRVVNFETGAGKNTPLNTSAVSTQRIREPGLKVKVKS